MNWGNLFAVVVLLVLPMSPAGAQDEKPPEPVADQKVDFASDIWPILKRHCLVCHGPVKQKGDLRLDSKFHVDAGGHTTNPILGSVDESELFRRITSNDDAYRMPPRGLPVPPEEIALIRRWLEQGAEWPDTVSTQTQSDYWWDLVDYYLTPVAKIAERIRPVLIAFTAFLLLMVIIERCKKMQSRQHRWTRGWAAGLFGFVAQIGFIHYLVALMAFVIAGMWLNDRILIRQLTDEATSLRKSGARHELTAPQRASRNELAAPIPLRPMHPPRLGGTYYRGNDERNPRLFNGGYYRTATLHVSLCNQDKQQLQWGDQVGAGPLYIRCEFERAANSIPALFREPMNECTFLSTQWSGTADADLDTPVPFETLEPGERWVAWYAVPLPPGPDATLSNMIYLYRGKLTATGRVQGFLHFGIQYDLRIEAGRITEDSEIWMGSLLDLHGRLAVTPEGKIPLNQWFDFLPIPEIVGSNTTDPELLGIPEHIPDYRPEDDEAADESPPPDRQ